MIRALWLALKIGLLVALCVWVADRPGSVRVEWMDYVFTVHLGFALLIGLVLIALCLFVYNIVKAFIDFPKSYGRYRQIRRREKGWRALTRGLAAVAAGDAKEARHQSKRANVLLDHENGLPVLLEAQAARLEGREDDAQESFLRLMESKDASFLGMRGLLQAALEDGNHEKALEIARAALKIYPKQKWISRTVYDLELSLHRWDGALKSLQAMRKSGAMEKPQIKSDHVALLMAQAEDSAQKTGVKLMERAVKIDPGFVPAAVKLAQYYRQAGKRRKAMNVVKACWKQAPHPALAEVWRMLTPPKKGKRALTGLRWFEKLLAVNDNAVAAQIEAGKLALEEKLWGEARSYLMRAEKLSPDAGVYHALVALEEAAGQNDEAAYDWQKKAENAPAAPVWVCRETGRVYKDWQPIASPHGAFNTIEWSSPDMVLRGAGALGAHVYDGDVEPLLSALKG